MNSREMYEGDGHTDVRLREHTEIWKKKEEKRERRKKKRERGGERILKRGVKISVFYGGFKMVCGMFIVLL